MKQNNNEMITPDKVFRMMNMLINRPCGPYALKIKFILPQIRRIAEYYRFLIRNSKLSSNQKKLMELFIEEAQSTEYILTLFKEDVERIEMSGGEVEIC